MKKLLFIVPNFETGGTISSLINILSLLNKDKYNSYVYAITGYGSMKEEIAQHAIIWGESHGSVGKKKTLRASFFFVVKRAFKFLRGMGIDLSGSVLKRAVVKLQKEEFDIVVAFQEGTASKMLSLFRDVKRVAWVRSVYSRYLKLNRCEAEIAMYNMIDTIVCVSEASRMDFISICPQLEQKVVRVYDVLNAERILRLSSESVEDYSHECFTIISIGRLDPVKRFSLIPAMAKELKRDGHKFKWLIIGGAPETNKQEERLIKERIRQNDVEENVILLGRKANPYSYLKQSDLLVCLSSSETFNYTLTEAKILGVPIVTTDYPCAKESVDDHKEGIITSIGNILNAIESMMTDKALYDEIKDNLSHYQYDNSLIMSDLHDKIFM